MVNKQLLDYISQQLKLGDSTATIRASLMSQNWSEQDVNEGFAAVEKSNVISTSPIPIASSVLLNMSTPSIGNSTSLWAKGIPKTNKVFMIISLLLVFGLDLFIAISSPDLKGFWYMMLAVFAVFAVFFCLENFVFSKKFANTTFSIDKWISFVVVIRNLLFILNFIPFIQLLGLAGILYGGWAIGIVYIGLIITRFNQTNKTI